MTPSRARFALSLSVVAALVACNQTTVQPTRGNLDRVTDIVVVNAGDGHSYTVTANPDLQHLRVVDLTTGAFVRAPNRYFPLSPPSAATELTVAVDVTSAAPDATRVFGLDPTTDTVDIVHVVDAADDADAFAIVGSFTTGRAPGDIAAIRLPTTTLLAVTIPAAGAVEIYRVDDTPAATLQTTLTLPDGAVPDRVVVDPLGTTFVVGDAVGNAVFMLEPTVDGSDVVLARTLDVGGPVSALAAGIVDIGDGQAPVVLVLHADGAAATLVRLFRRGYPEDRYAVLAHAELPNVGVAAYVPDVRDSAAATTVCCVGLTSDQIAAGEASAAWAGVLLADGRLLYLQLAAATIDGVTLGEARRALRLFDNDPAPPGAGVVRDTDGNITSEIDLNTEANLWVPTTGGEDRRPVVTLTASDNFGDPTSVSLVAPATSLLLTWQGDLPTTRALTSSAVDAVITTDVDLAARDVHVGDVARLAIVEGSGTCEASYRATIVAVDGTALTVATSDDVDDDTPALTTEARACLDTADLRLTVEASNAFVVTDGVGYRQRLTFDDVVVLPGRELSIAPASTGVPLTGSKLALPLDPRTTTLGLNLVGDFDARALVPTAITGGTFVIPDANSDVDDATIAARRMVVSAGSVDARLAQSRLFTFDEAETVSTDIEPLQ